MFYPGCGPSVFSYIYIHIFLIYSIFLFFLLPLSHLALVWQVLIRSLSKAWTWGLMWVGCRLSRLGRPVGNSSTLECNCSCSPPQIRIIMWCVIHIPYWFQFLPLFVQCTSRLPAPQMLTHLQCDFVLPKEILKEWAINPLFRFQILLCYTK